MCLLAFNKSHQERRHVYVHNKLPLAGVNTGFIKYNDINSLPIKSAWKIYVNCWTEAVAYQIVINYKIILLF